MKTTVFALTMLLCGFSAVAQEQTPTVQPTPSNPQASYNNGRSSEVRKNKSVTISKRAGEPQRTHDAAYYDEEIAKIDSHIASIDTKVAYMNADPTRKAQAEANGWFDDMDQIKSDLETKRADLVTKRNNL